MSSFINFITFSTLLSLIPTISSASETVFCKATKTFQRDEKALNTDAEINFELIRNGKNSEIKNLTGYVFVSYDSIGESTLSTENAYMGYFNLDSLVANPQYRPTKYKDYIQFKNMDATHTVGRESGMWGALILNINTPKQISAKYIFQAGDHMGGTMPFHCKSY